MSSGRGLGDDLGLPARLLGDLADAVQHHHVGRGLDVVEDLVRGRHEVVDVLAVDGRDERLVELADDVVHDLVADVLVLEDGGRDALAVAVVHELDEQLRGRVEVGREL